MCVNRSVPEYHSQANHVFHARGISVDTVALPEGMRDGSLTYPGQVVQARFELISSYKGSPQHLDAVYTHPSEIGCGLRIATGWQYVFFANADGFVTMCDGSVRRLPFGKWRKTISELKRLK